MEKLAALKAKIAALKQQLSDKLEKIPLIKKWREKRAVSAAAPPSPYGLGRLYREGGAYAKFQVFLVLIFSIGAAAGASFVGYRLVKRLSKGDTHKQMAAEYSKGLEGVRKRMEENASVLSLGQFMITAYVGENKQASMGLDIWVRVGDVEAANYIQANEVPLHDATMSALNDVYMRKVNLLTDAGKEEGKRMIRDSLNRALPKGKIEEIFFHNMIVQ